MFGRLGLIVALTAFASCGSDAEIEPADVVFQSGAIYTVDADRSWAEAVAIRGEEIVFVGSDADSASFVGDDTTVVDLAGKMMLPGFQDAHVHPVWSGMAYLGCPMFDVDTVDDYVQVAADCASRDPEKHWIVGDGWNLDRFAPSGIPHKGLLDAVIPDRPAAFLSADGHSIWVNSKALEAAGIDADTSDPAGGIINRDPATGEAVGALQEQGGINMILSQAPQPTEEEMLEGLRYALRHLNSLGITALQDALVKVDGTDAYATLDTYAILDNNDELSIRAVLALYWEYETIKTLEEGRDLVQMFVDTRERYTDGNIYATSIKIWLDGVLEAGTAAMLEDYTDAPGHRSEVTLAEDDLNEISRELDALGFQIHYHAIGDRAIRASLDAAEFARDGNGVRDSRHHICHVQVVQPSDIPRFRDLDVIANFQPLWAYEDGYITELTYPRIGPERSEYLYPIGSILRTGATVAFGSDWYVSSADPLAGIETAVTRLSAEGLNDVVMLPDERISLEDAIAAYTINSAFTNFLDERSGSIEVGKLADLIVLDQNLFEIDVSEISEARVLLTLLGGEPVYGDMETL